MPFTSNQLAQLLGQGMSEGSAAVKQQQAADLATQGEKAKLDMYLGALNRPEMQENLRQGGSMAAGPIHIGAAPRRSQAEELGLTPGQQAADVAFGKEYADYQAAGGHAGVEKNLKALEGVASDVEKQTGLERFLAYVPEVLGGRSLRESFAPADIAREDAVRNAIQSTLRQTLGAQFTAKEGEALMARAYNPRLSAEENKKRVLQAAQELRTKGSERERSGKYFEKKGTLKGLPIAGRQTAAAPPGGGGLTPEEQAELDQLRKEMGN